MVERSRQPTPWVLYSSWSSPHASLFFPATQSIKVSKGPFLQVTVVDHKRIPLIEHLVPWLTKSLYGAWIPVACKTNRLKTKYRCLLLNCFLSQLLYWPVSLIPDNINHSDSLCVRGFNEGNICVWTNTHIYDAHIENFPRLLRGQKYL